jgi:hypothetical protein
MSAEFPTIDEIIAQVESGAFSQETNQRSTQVPEPQPARVAEQEAAEVISYPIPPEVADKIRRFEGLLIDRLSNAGGDTPMSEGFAIDPHMPTHQRIFTRDPRPHEIYGVQPKSLEFIHFRTPDANPLRESLGGVKMSNQLTLELHTDKATKDAVEPLLHLPVNGFRPSTTLALEDKSNRIIKICKIPFSLNDARKDRLPDEPNGQYVLSPASRFDVDLMRDFLQDLASPTREER